MKLLISTFGTRGDVQPYLALAVGLRAAGHAVTLATSASYSTWIERYGIQTCPTPLDLQAISRDRAVQAALHSGNPLQRLRAIRGVFHDLRLQSVAAQELIWQAAQSADCVIQSPTGCGALEAAEVLGVLSCFAVPVPFAPTGAFPSFFQPLRRSLGMPVNRLTHRFAHALLWRIMGRPMSTHLRAKLGLQPLRSYAQLLTKCQQMKIQWLNGFSQHVVPKPADWPEDQQVTGYWFLDAPPDWQPSTALIQFLRNGPLPVYIGFGSMVHHQPQRQRDLVLRALELSGMRGVLATGWGGSSGHTAAPNLFVVDDAPHDWLFPQMAAVVHHGGAGTTAAALRAGVPNIITPFAPNDQPAWAARVAALAVGIRLPAIKRLTAQRLADAMHKAVDDDALRTRAAPLGQEIRAEAGVQRAVEIIERHVMQM